MVEASLSKKGKVAAKELGDCIQSAMADGDFILANKLYELAMNKYPNHFKTLVGNEDVRALAAANVDKMNNEQLATVNESASGIDNKEERVAYKQTIQEMVVNDEQRKQVANLHIEDKDQEVRIGVVDNLRNKAKTPEAQDEIDVIIREKGDIPTRSKAIETTKELDSSIQLKSLERQVNDNIPELLKVAVGVPSTLEESAKAGEIVFNATGKIEDDSVRISLQNKLADDVVNYKKPEDQLAMHDILMTAKDQEVLEHAASNIYKYDESVQAGALDSTKATGNEGAIDAAMANYDKYAPSVQEDPKYQAMMHETEVRQSQEIAQQVADFHVEYEKITGMKSNIEQEISDRDQKLNYIRSFLNASPQEQFKMLSKIPMSWQGTVFSKIATFCPQMLSGLVKQGYGKHILNTPGLSSDVIYKVVNIMLTSQSSDKKVAVKYVKSHQSMFSASTIERCEEILSSDNMRTKKYSSMPLFSSVKGALAPKKSDNYPNKVDLDVYNA